MVRKREDGRWEGRIVVGLWAEGKSLPPQYRDHALSGDYAGQPGVRVTCFTTENFRNIIEPTDAKFVSVHSCGPGRLKGVRRRDHEVFATITIVPWQTALMEAIRYA